MGKFRHIELVSVSIMQFVVIKTLKWIQGWRSR